MDVESNLQKEIVDSERVTDARLAGIERSVVEVVAGELQQKEIILDLVERTARNEEIVEELRNHFREGFGLAPRNTSIATLEYMIRDRELEIDRARTKGSEERVPLRIQVERTPTPTREATP